MSIRKGDFIFFFPWGAVRWTLKPNSLWWRVQPVRGQLATDCLYWQDLFQTLLRYARIFDPVLLEKKTGSIIFNLILESRKGPSVFMTCWCTRERSEQKIENKENIKKIHFSFLVLTVFGFWMNELNESCYTMFVQLGITRLTGYKFLQYSIISIFLCRISI